LVNFGGGGGGRIPRGRRLMGDWRLGGAGLVNGIGQRIMLSAWVNLGGLASSGGFGISPRTKMPIYLDKDYSFFAALYPDSIFKICTSNQLFVKC